MKKIKLHEKVLYELKKLCLLLVSYVHEFFTSVQWYYHFLKLLDPSYGMSKFEKSWVIALTSLILGYRIDTRVKLVLINSKRSCSNYSEQ